MSAKHAETVIEVKHESETGLTYIKFCRCDYGRTDSFMQNRYSLFSDWDSTRSHIIGLEVHHDTKKDTVKQLEAGLRQTALTEKQKIAALKALPHL